MDDLTKLNKIQSRIIGLKQKAAEVDILRAERDELVNKLKEYSQDYIYPDLPKTEEYNEIVCENAQLMQKLFDGGLTVKKLEKKVKDLQQIVSQVDELTKDNEILKQKEAEVVALEHQIIQLLEEKKAIKNELWSAVAVEDQSDPVAKWKRDINRLYVRMERLEEEKESLTKEVEERTRRVEELAREIRELEERVAERPGGGGPLEEGLRVHVLRLEEANREIGQELAELTEKVSAAGDLRDLRLEEANLRQIGDLTHQEVMASSRFQAQDASHTPWARSSVNEDDVLSSGGPVREFSEEDELVTEDQMDELLSQLACNTYYIGKIHKKLDRLRFEVLRSTTEIKNVFHSSSMLLLDNKFIGYGRVGTSVMKIEED